MKPQRIAVRDRSRAMGIAGAVVAALIAAVLSPAGLAQYDEFEKPENRELRQTLAPLQYHVTQEEGTEPPFQNAYWNNKRAGIYVDVISGEPLFSSLDKYDSGTGWPSFTRPVVAENVVTKLDFKIIVPRTELRSRYADSHLGHVFKDGPKDKGGLRYCINSAALRFVPAADLEGSEYAAFKPLFDEPEGASSQASN